MSLRRRLDALEAGSGGDGGESLAWAHETHSRWARAHIGTALSALVAGDPAPPPPDAPDYRRAVAILRAHGRLGDAAELRRGLADRLATMARRQRSGAGG